MVELITVIVIVGILAVSVLPRFFDVNTFKQRGAEDQIKSAVRYAQKVAIAQHRQVSVTIQNAAHSNCAITLIAGNVLCEVEAVVATNTFHFNALGQPVNAMGGALAVSGSVSVGGGAAFVVEAETGYVH